MSSAVGATRGNAFQPATQPAINYNPRRREASVDSVTSKGNKTLAKFIIIVIAVIFILIGFQAYTATLQYENNILLQENEYLQAEIDSIKSQIVEETKVTRIESIATHKYGMVYPTSDNCITIYEGKEGGENLAATIKGEAYN
ncbi:MAG: cell division protein FtsL [Clostridiales bacterium]|nr:cell division protein FtsL [Clostridiales bacterium]